MIENRPSAPPIQSTLFLSSSNAAQSDGIPSLDSKVRSISAPSIRLNRDFEPTQRPTPSAGINAVICGEGKRSLAGNASKLWPVNWNNPPPSVPIQERPFASSATALIRSFVNPSSLP